MAGLSSPAGEVPAARSLAALFEQVARADDPERALLDLVLARAQERDPELPRAIRLAAIPRRFDAEILARLRGEDGPGDATHRLVVELVGLSFVRARRGGDWSVNDTTRDLLLAEWRSTAATREEFDRHNRALSALYQARHSIVAEDERTLGMVSALLRRVSPERYGQLVSEIEAREIAPLLEALYHETLRSADDGYEFFTRSFQRHEAEGRSDVCASLLHALRDYFDRLPVDARGARWIDWLRYYEARLQNRVRNYDEALTILEDLQRTVTADVKLRLWVLSELGGLHRDRFHLHAAREAFEEELALAVETRVDPYNIPGSYLRLAALYWSLSALDVAARLYRHAIRSAAAEGRSDLEIGSRADLSRVLQERADLPGARAEAVRALDIARRRPTVTSFQDGAAMVFMGLSSRESPVLIDTLARERQELLAPIAGESAELALQLEYANQLRNAGRLARALAVLQAVASSPASAKPGGEDTLFLLRLGLTLEELGRMDEAAAAYTRLVESAARASDRFNVAAALANRGSVHRDCGRFEEAAKDFQEAFEVWHGMGMGKLAALMHALAADAAIIAARSAALTEQARTGSGDLDPASAGELRGDLAFLRADWPAAAAAYDQARSRADRAGQGGAVGNLHGRMAVVAGATGQWEAAAAHAGAAAEAWRGPSAAVGARAGVETWLAPELLADAQAAVDAARRHVNHEMPGFLGDLHRLQADIHRVRGDDGPAYSCLCLMVSQPEATSDPNGVAGARIDAARLAGRLGRFGEAAEHAARAAEIWRELVAAEAQEPSESATRADAENARGMRDFTAAAKARAGVVRPARDAFLSASRLQPRNWWYALNLSYACAELHEWADAAAALEDALRSGPTWLRPSALGLRLAEYHMEHARGLIELGQQAVGAATLAAAEKGLEAVDPGDTDLLPELTESWMKLGDGRDALGSLVDAEGYYRRALSVADAAGAAWLRGQLHARLAFLAARAGQVAAAMGRLRLGAELLHGADPAPPYQRLVRELGPLVRTAEDYDALTEVLHGLAADATLTREARRDVIEARLQLNRERFEATHRTPVAGAQAPAGTTPALLPAVTPVAINGHPGLFPPGEEWAATHPLFVDYIPAARARIERELGVVVPGIRVRPVEDLPSETYLILLDEVPLVTHGVEVGRWFCPDVAAASLRLGRDLSAAAVPNPFTDRSDGVWLEEPDAATLRNAGLPSWDQFEFMIRHLELVQRRHLRLFLGLQELEQRLEQWVHDDQPEPRPERAELVAQALPDQRAKHLYLQVAHGLLAEGVPIVDQDLILKAFLARGDDDAVTQAIEAARRLLRQTLPGNTAAHTFLRCAPGFEGALASAVVRRGRARFLAVAPALMQRLLAGVKAALGDRHQADVSLVSRTEGLRPFLRRLVELEFPRVNVLDAAELLPDLDTRSDATIEYPSSEAS
jgi:tetratricopeptide (TPR) repeat protein